MNQLYDDQLMMTNYQGWLSEALSPEDPNEEVSNSAEYEFRWLLDPIHTSLSASVTDSLPPLNLHGRSERKAFSEELFANEDGVHVGLRFMDELTTGTLVLASYLCENFLFQLSTVKDMPPDAQLIESHPPRLEDLLSVDRFPNAALALYSAQLIPGALFSDGYRKSDFQILMEIARSLRMEESGWQPEDTDQAFMPKPLLDLQIFLTEFGEEPDPLWRFKSALGPYIQRLHMHLLLDACYLLIAHELSHFILGHVSNANASDDVRRGLEMDADMKALQMLDRVPGFRHRALPIIFNFLHGREPHTTLEEMSHPLSHNRLVTLTESLLSRSDGDQLRADINAGMALLATEGDILLATIAWPDGHMEEVPFYVSHYCDLDFRARLYVHVHRAAESIVLNDWLADNAFLLAHLSYEIDFSLRDRIDPEIVYSQGRVRYQPEVRPTDLLSQGLRDSFLTRMTLEIPAPPEWCLVRPQSEVAITNVTITHAPPKTGGQSNPIRFEFVKTDFDLDLYLESLAGSPLDQSIRARLINGARRYSEFGQYGSAIVLYRWLYQREASALSYYDLRRLCGMLLEMERSAEAAEIATNAIRAQAQSRPGFHLCLMMHHSEQGRIQEAYEHAFLEMFTVGVYGEFFDDARAYGNDLIANSSDAAMLHMRDYMDCLRRLEEHKHGRARGGQARELARARTALLRAQAAATRDFVFLRQLIAEVDFTALELGSGIGSNQDAVRVAAEFDAVLELMPSFAPALIHLARISLRQGDITRANDYWKAAQSVAPFNKFVFDFWEELQDSRR